MDFLHGKELTSLMLSFPYLQNEGNESSYDSSTVLGKMTIWNFKHYRRKYRILITQIILWKWEQKKTKVCIYLITLIACGKYMDYIVHINTTPSYIKDTVKNVSFLPSPPPPFWLYNNFAWKKIFFLLIFRDLNI